MKMVGTIGGRGKLRDSWNRRRDDIIERIRRNQSWAITSRAEMLIALGEFDALGLAESCGETSTAGWLARETRIATSTAFEYVGVARRLPDFPLLTDAFRAARISYSTVRYLLKFITSDNEARLVDLAEKLCFAELQRALAGVGQRDDEEQAPKYHHDVRIAENGDVIVTARLNPVDGAAYLSALKIAQLAHYGLNDVDADGDVDGDVDVDGDGDREETIDAALKRHRARPEANPGTECPPERPRRISDYFTGAFSRVGPPVREDMYGALLAMIHMVRCNPVSELRTPGAHVNIMMTTNGRAWLPGNVEAPSQMLENYVNDAFVRLQLMDKDGLSLHLGRRSRFVNDAQFRALLAVWGFECAMPGCNHRRFLQVHHIKEWCRGGETNMDNLIPLCSACHSRVTNGLAHISTDGRKIEFRFASGRRFISTGHGLPERAAAFSGPVVPPEPEEREDSFDD